MNTNLEVEPETSSDACLVEAVLAGDREAFGHIVARYQSPVCALAYSACGNVPRSEDLAQEIFITAWRKLETLQEPAKFRAWLYGIARNLINNTFRQQTRNPVAGAQVLEEGAESSPSGDGPDEQAISKEEEAILWHVLSGLPQVYREPMVLFYRQNESVPQVAEVLAISEDAVRQRLSRGRTLLSERVSKVIRNGLRRSRPGDTFAVAVIAALPMFAAATTAKGAIMGVAATRGTTGQATGLLGVLKGVGFFTGLIALPVTLGSYLGHKLGQDATGSPRQRKSAAKFWRVFGGGMLLFLFLPLLLVFGVTGFLPGDSRPKFLSVMTVWLGLAYPFVFGSLAFWIWQRFRRSSDAAPDPAIREIEPAGQAVAARRPNPGKKISTRLILFLTLAAAALLVFCFHDMNGSIRNLSSAEIQGLINQNAPGELRASILVYHYRSMFRESPEVYRSFMIEVRKDGKSTRYDAKVDEAVTALLAQKGIACQTYVEGRDFEVLGTPGRDLPFLAAFLLGIGAIFLLKRSRTARAGTTQAA